MKQLRKPAKRLSERLNKKRNLRLTLKLNVPRKHDPGKGRPIEDLIYASKDEQRLLKSLGGKGKKTKHGIRSFVAPPSRAQTDAKNRAVAAAKSTVSSGARGTTGMQQGSNSFNNQKAAPSGRDDSSRDVVGANKPAAPSTRTQNNDRGTLGMQQGSNSFNEQQAKAALGNPTQKDVMREGVRSLSERMGISTPDASGSPLNNPASMNVQPGDGSLMNSIIQKQAAAATPVEDLTRAAYQKSMVGVEDLSKAAYDAAHPAVQTSVTAGGGPVAIQNLGFSAPAAPLTRSLAPPVSVEPQTNNFVAPDTVAAQLTADIKNDVELSPSSYSDISGEVEDLRGPNPSVAEGQLPGFGPGGIKTSFDANVDFLGSRGTGLDTEGMNPDFTRSLGEAVRAAELATGTKAKITELSRDPRVQAQYYANYKGRDVVWDGKTYSPQKKGGLAAPPGNSRHQLGAAVDIARGPVRNWMQENSAQFGLGMLPAKLARIDPVHFQQIGTRPTQVANIARKEPVETLVSRMDKFSPPSNFSAPAAKPLAPAAAPKVSGPLTRQALNLKAPAVKLAAKDLGKPPTPSVVAGAKQKNLGGHSPLAESLSQLSKLSAPNMLSKVNEAASFVKQFADAQTGFGSSITGTIANKIVAKEASKAIVSAQRAIASWQKGTLTKVAAAEELQKAQRAAQKVQVASVAPTMKPTLISTKPAVAKPTVVAKIQDRLVPEPEQTIASKIFNNIPAVKAYKKIAGVTGNIAKKLTTSVAYEEDQKKLASMTPAQRVAELSRRERDGGYSNSPKKLTASVLDKAAKDASTAVAKSKYTSEGYLA